LYKVDQGSWNHNPNSLYSAPITDYELMNTIGKLKNSYSMGYDEFPEIIIKKLRAVPNKTSCPYFQLIFSEWHFP
jgi:hypothetical protein